MEDLLNELNEERNENLGKKPKGEIKLSKERKNELTSKAEEFWNKITGKKDGIKKKDKTEIANFIKKVFNERNIDFEKLMKKENSTELDNYLSLLCGACDAWGVKYDGERIKTYIVEIYNNQNNMVDLLEPDTTSVKKAEKEALDDFFECKGITNTEDKSLYYGVVKNTEGKILNK